jgi:TPR repeat protein
VVLVAVLGAQARPGFEDGLLAYHRGDHATALEIWRSLAEQGHAASQYSLGLLYYRGEGVLPDPKQAAKWYRKAADQGDPDAQLNLGLMYAQGEGVKKDYVDAYKWFALAFAYYPPGESRDAAYRNRENVAAVMSAGQIEKAERLARRWKPKTR